MRGLTVILLVSLAAATQGELLDSLCSVCDLGWQAYVPEKWAQLKAYSTLICASLDDATLQALCRETLSFIDLSATYDKFQPKLIEFGNKACEHYCPKDTSEEETRK